MIEYITALFSITAILVSGAALIHYMLRYVSTINDLNTITKPRFAMTDLRAIDSGVSEKIDYSKMSDIEMQAHILNEIYSSQSSSITSPSGIGWFGKPPNNVTWRSIGIGT